MRSARSGRGKVNRGTGEDRELRNWGTGDKVKTGN